MTEDIATLTPLEQLNLDVAAIAGWGNIEEWNPNPKTRKPKKTFTGTNKKHPELGVHIPDYTRDLNAIAFVLNDWDIFWALHKFSGYFNAVAESPSDDPADSKSCLSVVGDSEAIALCKLLLQLAPTLPKSEEVQVIDDDGDIDEPKVIDAFFG